MNWSKSMIWPLPRTHDIDIFFCIIISQEVKLSFSCSLNDSAFVKDMRWTTSSKSSYVVLSNTGQLYHGEAGFPLKHVIDSVEAGMLYSSVFNSPVEHVHASLSICSMFDVFEFEWSKGTNWQMLKFELRFIILCVWRAPLFNYYSLFIFIIVLWRWLWYFLYTVKMLLNFFLPWILSHLISE